MNYYKLQESTDEKYLVETNIDNISMVRGFKTTLTSPLGKEFPKLDISVTYFKILPDYFYAGPFLLISEKLKRLLEKLNIDFEYHPVNIKNKTSKNINQSYYYAHLLSEYDFIDKSKSIYETSEYSPEYIDEIEKLVLKKDIEVKFSYLEKCIDRSFVLISGHIAEALIENQITGIELQPVEDIKN